MSASEPTRPIDAYKQIIDQLVTETRPSISAQWVLQKGIYTNRPDTRDAYNGLVQSLTPAQRQLLAEMLQHEREGGIHDTLAVLTWAIECDDIGLTYRGEQIFKPVDTHGPIGLSGVGMYGDFVSRAQGYPWQEE